MTAIFFSRSDLDFDAFKEYANENKFFEVQISNADNFNARQTAYVKKIGNHSWIAFLKNIRKEDFLCFGEIKTQTERLDFPLEHLDSLIDYVSDVIYCMSAEDESVRIFWHNGHDIPNGYEAWANMTMQKSEGYEEWKMALLSSTRNASFNLTNLDKDIPKENLLDEERFCKWADELISKLTSCGGVA